MKDKEEKIKRELLKLWEEYTEYLQKYGVEEITSISNGYHSFFWFMVWIKDGKLPGKKFNK